jgi:ABC-type multidrug transport system permease subunit
MQNQLFAIFMLLTIFGNIIQQMMPHFVIQRALYEVRERPSKTYSWQVFIFSNIFAEIPWNSLMAVIIYITWYFPIGLYRNAEATDAVSERAGLMFLYVWAFFMFTSTFCHLVIAGMETAENAGNIANLLFSLCLIFCGVLAGPGSFPQFWIFMYRISPFTYLVSGIMSTGLANTAVQCDPVEFLRFSPPPGQTCAQYLDPYTAIAGGYLKNGTGPSTATCEFCPLSDTNAFLSRIFSNYNDRWRNFGLLWPYIIFNIAGAVFFYWLARVPKVPKKKKEKKE